MSQSDLTPILNDVFLECCISLFDGLGCDVVPVDRDDGALRDAPFGFIDAGTDDFELTLALRLPFSVLVLTYPISEGMTTPDDETLEDWISELSNQLVGKVKRRLMKYGCHLKIGLPTALFGADINESMPQCDYQYSVFLSVDHEVCECRLGLELFNVDAVLIQSSQEDDSSEGELELF